MRRSFLIVALIVLAGAFGLGFWLSRPKPVSLLNTPAQTSPPEETSKPAPAIVNVPQPQQPSSPMAVPPATPGAGQPEPSAETRQLLAALVQVKGPITPELAAFWKTNLMQLVQHGPAAVPAIREFLAQNKDIPYDYKQGGSLLGAHSLRLGLLQALESIGGSEAVQLAVDTLQTTTEPREIAQIARHLEKQAEGQYRETILNAARESMAMAAAGKLGQTDAGPLFNVMAQYGGANAIGDFQKVTSPYRYYAALALAQLPDGAGIAPLSQMLRQPNGPPRATHNAALEALAQLAPAYPEAREIILQQARLKQIPETVWPSVAESLTSAKFFIRNLAEDGLTPQSGDKTYHIGQGPQDFFSRRDAAPLTPEQKQQMAQFLDQLLQTEVPALGLESLQKSKEKVATP